MKHHPRNLPSNTVEQIVTELIAFRRSEGTGKGYLNHLECNMLKRNPDRRARMSKNTAKKEESVGTTISAKERDRANRYSDTKRQQLLERGLSMIYGGSALRRL